MTEHEIAPPEPEPGPARGYDAFYERFDSPLMGRLRQEAYGRDIGQHSWVTADELEQDIAGLELTHASRLLDLGCGPGGPLTFVVREVGCHATGIDVSPHAIESARTRATSFGLGALIELQVADSNEPLPFHSASFDAVIAIDVVLHLHDRAIAVAEVARVLAPRGRFLFTDAGVVTGPVSNQDVQWRSMHGYTQFVPPGFNERTIKAAGLRLIDVADRTTSLLTNANGRLASRIAHKQELEQLEGAAYFESQLHYLETVVALSDRGALSRIMYLAERDA